MAAWFFGLLAAGETIRMIYLWATGGKISPIACLMEILLLLLISFFCSNKNRKKQEEARLSGPLVTEERQKQAKKGQKEPIVICPEGKPYLIAAIGFYVVFLVSAIAMLVWFSWPKVLLSGTLGGICLYDLYKYMRIKTDIAAAKDREPFLQRKKQARREAAKGRRIRKVEQMILTHGWAGLDNIWQRRAEKLLDDERIEELVLQRNAAKVQTPPEELQVSLF